ncbi:MAG TPA: hypothetical protein VNJ12_06450 [Candidatus Dormibacteraeota bacterium]|nr:hypothetical protein [Candidatus Dormibacteraeota bacterium]
MDHYERIPANDLRRLHALALRLIVRPIVFPSLNHRLVETADNGNIVGIVAVQQRYIADLPGGQHVRDEAVDLLRRREREKRRGRAGRRRLARSLRSRGPHAGRNQQQAIECNAAAIHGVLLVERFGLKRLRKGMKAAASPS